MKMKNNNPYKYPNYYLKMSLDSEVTQSNKVFSHVKRNLGAYILGATVIAGTATIGIMANEVYKNLDDVSRIANVSFWSVATAFFSTTTLAYYFRS